VLALYQSFHHFGGIAVAPGPRGGGGRLTGPTGGSSR
jgi:hypothetical protein